MSRSMIAAALVGLAATANAQECKTALQAANDAGLDALLGFATGVAEALPGNPVIESFMKQVFQSTPAVDGRVTVFAPSNEAFAEIAAVAATLSAEEQLTVLLNHILSTEFTSSGVVAALDAAAPEDVTVQSLASFALDISTADDAIFVTPFGSDESAEVIAVDVDTCVGTIHVVDKVLVPVFEQAVAFQSSDMAGAYGEEEVDGVYGGAGMGGMRGGPSGISDEEEEYDDMPALVESEAGEAALATAPAEGPVGTDEPVEDDSDDAVSTPVTRVEGSDSASADSNTSTEARSSSGGVSGATAGYIAGGAAAAVLAGVAAAMIYKKRSAGAGGASGALSHSVEV